MSSCLKDAVNDLKAQVSAIAWAWGADTDRNRANKLFQKVAIWNDQVNREQSGQGYLFAKPACFVEPMQMTNEQLLDGVTYSDYIWRLHIVDMELDSGNGDMDENMTILDYRDEVKRKITGFQPANCSTLFSVDDRPDYTHNDVYHYIIDFKSGFTDTKGSYLDPDQTIYIYKEPPTNLELVSTFDDRPVPINPLYSYVWKVCQIRAQIVDTPDPTQTQTLDNGAVIPLQYAPSDPIYDENENITSYRKLTIPYLVSTPGIAVLTPFLIDNGVIAEEDFYPTTGTFDNADNGGFFIGNDIAFNASLPMAV